MRTIEQQRAANALARVNELHDRYRKSKTFKERYRSYVDRLGPAIVMNGLGQALATERAAAGAPPRNDDEKAHLEGGGDLHRRGTVPCRVGRSTDRHRLVRFVQRVVRGGRLGPWR